MADAGRSAGIFAVLMLGLAAGWGYTFLSARLGVAFAIPVGVVGALSVAIVLRGPLGQALAHHLGLRESLPDQTAEQLLGELDEMKLRMQELEERVDFSERLLAQQPRDASR
jgi:hypothetical protein